MEAAGQLARAGAPCWGALLAAGISQGRAGQGQRDLVRGPLLASVLGRIGSPGLWEQQHFLLAHLRWVGPGWPPESGAQSPHRKLEGQHPRRRQEVSLQPASAWFPKDQRAPDLESSWGPSTGGFGPMGPSREDWVCGLPPKHSRAHLGSALGAELFCSETKPGTENRGCGHQKEDGMPSLLPRDLPCPTSPTCTHPPHPVLSPGKTQ